MVDSALDARLTSAACTAKVVLFRLFDTVADNLYPASGTHGRQFMDRTFKTIENVRAPRRYNLERKIIIISANFALCHVIPPFQLFQIRFRGGNGPKMDGTPAYIFGLVRAPIAHIEGVRDDPRTGLQIEKRGPQFEIYGA